MLGLTFAVPFIPGKVNRAPPGANGGTTACLNGSGHHQRRYGRRPASQQRSPMDSPPTVLPHRRTQPMYEKLEALGINAFCERIEEGESQASIARSLGISKARITEWLQADTERSARAREARTHSSESLYELAHTSITDAADSFELAKAREEAQHLRRWAAI